jgi:hypothetical protein
MRNGLRSIWREICFRLRLHPSYEELLAFRDAEVGEAWSQWIAAHLSRCRRCQVERGQIEEDVARFLSRDPWLKERGLLPLGEGLVRLRLAIRNYEISEFSDSGRARTASRREQYMGQRVAAELGLYLGPRAAATLLQGMGNGRRDLQELVGAADPVLTAFYGQATASAVTSRISRIWNRYHPGESRRDLHV